MKKRSLKEKFRYYFDNIMSGGTMSMIGLLFLATLIVIVVIALVISIVTGSNFGFNVWNGFLHVIDGGTIAGDPVDGVLYIALMFIVTMFGIFITSILIGIITTGFEEKLEDLKKSNSEIIDEGHTVIIGWNDRIYLMMESLIEANENHKNMCIAIVDEKMEAPEMNEDVREHIEDFKTTHILCRSGDPSELSVLKKVGVENARSVILNLDNDEETVKVLLSIVFYLREFQPLYPELHITAIINNIEYIEPAKLVGGKRAEIIYAKDSISRLVAHTCGQNGMSSFIRDILSYDGDELYFEKVPEAAGKKFSEVLNMFENEVVFGIVDEDGVPYLNPDMDRVVGETDRLILLEEDDGVFVVMSEKPVIEEDVIIDRPHHAQLIEGNLLVLGFNNELTDILAEYDNYVVEDTKVRIVFENDNTKEIPSQELKNIVMESVPTERINKDVVIENLTDEFDNVLILSDEGQDNETSDVETLLRLIDLRAVKEETGRQFFVTSEMFSRKNQRLAEMIGVSDFVIGSNILSLLCVQVSENRGIAPLFMDLLDEEGSELYMKPAGDYVKTKVPVNFFTVTESAARKGEIAVGIKKVDTSTGAYTIVSNPKKSDKIIFTNNDFLIVVAED